MNLRAVEQNKHKIAMLAPGEIVADARAAMDLIAAVRYETGCDRVAMAKEALPPEFFRLSTGLAGEMLQKFVNYRVKLAVYGDFAGYTSKPLQDFIRESNRGQDVFFVGTREEAVERLSK